MAEEKKEFQFVTEVPKNVWGPEFEDIFVYPMYDDSKVAMEITVAEGVSKIAWEVIDNGNVIAAGSSDALEAGKVFKTTETIENFKPWNVNTPYLYKFRTILTVNGEDKECTIRFGMRKFSVDKDSFYLNNENSSCVVLSAAAKPTTTRIWRTSACTNTMPNICVR